MLTEGQEILEGRFKIVKKLGAGAFGEIFKGKSIYWSLVIHYSIKAVRTLYSIRIDYSR